MNEQSGSPDRTFYKQFIAAGDLCFDVGANVGEKTETFLELGARVVAIEPQPNCAKILQDKFGQNGNCHILETALAEKPGEASMHVNTFHPISTLSPEWIKVMQKSGRFQDNLWDSQITIKVATLDQLIAQFGIPNFCKIDVEGYEWNVLSGVSQALPALSIEFHQETFEEMIRCIQLLLTLGKYEFNYCIGNNLRLELDEWVDSQEICRIMQQIQGELMWGDVYARVIP